MSKGPLDVEMMKRPMINRATRAQTPTRTFHNGMIFNSGMLHKGGRSHVGTPRGGGDLLAHKPENNQAPAPIFMAGNALSTHFALPSSTRATNSPRRTPQRAESPVVGQTGRKYIVPTGNGDVIGHTTPVRFNTPDRLKTRNHGTPPRDSYIPGINQSEAKTRVDANKPRGMKHMDGPPEWKPDVFKPYAYTRQKGIVTSKPMDSPILGQSTRNFLSNQPLRQEQAIKCGRQRIEPHYQQRYDIISGQPM